MLHIYQFESTIYAWSAARFRGCLAPPSRLPVPPSHSQTNSLTALKHLSGHCLGGQNLLRRQGAVPGNILSLFGADNVILALHKLHPSAAGLLMGLPPRQVRRRAGSVARPSRSQAVTPARAGLSHFGATGPAPGQQRPAAAAGRCVCPGMGRRYCSSSSSDGMLKT